MKMPEYGIEQMINSALVCKRKSDTHERHYIGASLLGDQCDRKIWYYRYEPPAIKDGRVLRIFRIGDYFEDFVIEMLRDAGVKVFNVDENGKQFGFVDGEVSGHCDGVVVGLPESDQPHVLEVKSMNNSTFNQLKKKGLKATNIKYYGQIQVYTLKLELQDGLFIAMNKDNQELYFERLKLDKFYAMALIEKGKEIAKLTTPPKRTFKKNFYLCNMCGKKKECYEDTRE